MNATQSPEYQALIHKLKIDHTPLKDAATITPDGTVLAWSECVVICNPKQVAQVPAHTVEIGGVRLTGDNTVADLVRALKA